MSKALYDLINRKNKLEVMELKMKRLTTGRDPRLDGLTHTGFIRVIDQHIANGRRMANQWSSERADNVSPQNPPGPEYRRMVIATILQRVRSGSN